MQLRDLKKFNNGPNSTKAREEEKIQLHQNKPQSNPKFSCYDAMKELAKAIRDRIITEDVNDVIFYDGDNEIQCINKTILLKT